MLLHCMLGFEYDNPPVMAFLSMYREQDDELKPMEENYNITQPMLNWTLSMLDFKMWLMRE